MNGYHRCTYLAPQAGKMPPTWIFKGKGTLTPSCSYGRKILKSTPWYTNKHGTFGTYSLCQIFCSLNCAGIISVGIHRFWRYPRTDMTLVHVPDLKTQYFSRWYKSMSMSMYKKYVKPILFRFSPDFAHNITVRAGRVVQGLSPMRYALRTWWAYEHPSLEQEILGITFKNPVGLSAGFDKNVQLTPLIESVGFGFETAGSVTLPPRKGNPRPWFHRLPNTRSLVVYAGMANHGLTSMTPEIRHNQKKLHGMPLAISVAVAPQQNEYHTYDDAIIDAKNATSYIIHNDLAQMIEINISCPNVGAVPFSEPKLLDKLLTELDTVDRTVPFFAKMPYLEDLQEFDELLEVIARHNIQGVTIANLVKDRDNVSLSDPLTDEIKGGLSGAPTRKQNVELIRHTYRGYGNRFVIAGVGGIFSAEEAYEKIRAGASLVELITGMMFEGPQLIGTMNRELVDLLRHDGFTNISQAVGADFTLRQKAC